MITYFYWAAVIALAMAFLFVLGKYNHWRSALITSLIILITGWGAYYFHFEQVFVKRFGGVMSITVPEGQQHIAATWKDDNLWVQNYDPETNTCHFNEYSKGNLLQGRVTIKDCNPVKANQLPVKTAHRAAAPVTQDIGNLSDTDQ